MASALFNKATGLRFADTAKDKPLPIGMRPTEESRREHFRALAQDHAVRNGGNALANAFRRAHYQ